MVDSIAGIGSSFVKESTSKADEAKNAFSASAETYLQLFLEQLKLQDPTQPFEIEQMTNQLSMLSNAQQGIRTNENLEELISLQSNSQASSIASLINKDVEYSGKEAYFDGENEVKFTYELDDKFKSALVEVRDEADNLVFKKEVEPTAGKHEYSWSGKDGNDKDVDPGKYQISVVAKNSGDKFSEFDALIKGNVSGVDFTGNGNPAIFIGPKEGGVSVDLAKVGTIFSTNINNNNNNNN